jgi:quercetin dioxygenase-like cupin family protein
MKYIVHENEMEELDLPGRKLRWLITPEMDLTTGVSLNTVVIQPGNTVHPAHSHPNCEELIYVVSGSGKVFIDGSVHSLSKGTTVLFKQGMKHMVRNDGSEDLKLVCVFSPPATKEDYTYHAEITFPDNE